MNRSSTVGQIVAGTIGGFLAGGVVLGAVFVLVFQWEMMMWYYGVALSVLIGGAVGAAASATGMQKVLRQRLGREEAAIMRRVLIGALMLGLLGLLAIGIPLAGLGIWILCAGSDSEPMQRLVFGFLYTTVGLTLSLLAAWRLWRAVKDLMAELGWRDVVQLSFLQVRRSGEEFKMERGPSFTRHGNDTHCKKCGFELIGSGGPCRKCDDVQTRPCASCSRCILPNDKTCPYCGVGLR